MLTYKEFTWEEEQVAVIVAVTGGGGGENLETRESRRQTAY